MVAPLHDLGGQPAIKEKGPCRWKRRTQIAGSASQWI